MPTRKQPDSSSGDEAAGSAQEMDALAGHVRDLKAENEDLRRRLDGLAETMGTVLGLDQIGRGISEIVEELAPLRKLVPSQIGDPLPPRTILALKRLRASLDRPDWANVESFPFNEPEVGFIGQVPLTDREYEAG